MHQRVKDSPQMKAAKVNRHEPLAWISVNTPNTLLRTFQEKKITHTWFKSGRIRMRLPIKANEDMEENLFDSRFCAEEGLPKSGRWRKAYLSADMNSIYSTCWAGELELSDECRIYDGTEKRSSSGICCYDASRGL